MLPFFRAKSPKLSLSTSLLSIRFISNPTSNSISDSEKPTSDFYDDLINQAGRAGDFSTVETLLSQRITAGLFNTTNTFTFVVDDPNSLLGPTIKSIAALPHTFGRKNAFDSLIARLCKSREIDHARHVLDEMLQQHYGPNAISFHPIISTLSRQKRLDDVLRTLAFMKEQFIPPDAACYNYIICAYCHVGELSAAGEMLSAMLADGLVPDSLTFDALVIGSCRVGRLDAAVSLVRRMEEDGVKVLYCSYAHVITNLLGMGAYEEALDFVRAVGGRDGRVDLENFGVLGRGLLRRKRWEELGVVLREMKERGLEIEEKLKDAHQLHLSQVRVAQV